MLNIFKQKTKGETIVLKIDGMHCTSCSMSIDGELEEVDGVIESNTSYAKSKTKVTYNPKLVDLEKIKQVIESLEYKIVS